MRSSDRANAERMRACIERGQHSPAKFRAALLDVAPDARDAWVDVVLGLEEIPDDGADLPRGCVPYLPCPVAALLEMVERAPVRADDVFVDLGSGVGRAAALVHLLTDATAIGLEIQVNLVDLSREMTRRLPHLRVSTVHGDAAQLDGVATGSVYFLYCPFGQDRLAQTLASLEPIARTRPLRICSVDLPFPEVPWLTASEHGFGDLRIHHST